MSAVLALAWVQRLVFGMQQDRIDVVLNAANAVVFTMMAVVFVALAIKFSRHR